MYNIIPLVLILICLAVIIVIIVRKFPVLANLDVKNIPVEKEARFKEQIISNRLKRNFTKWSSRLARPARMAVREISNFLKWLFIKLNKLKDSYAQEKALSGDDKQQKIEQLFREASELEKHDDLDIAEKKYIEIISLDSKNIKAFKALGQLYYERKDYEEAKQTFGHILKLKEDDEEVYEGLAKIAQEKGNLAQARDEYLKVLDIDNQHSQTYFDLALVYKAMENIDEAISNMKKALKIEPNNPRYLDIMLELSIIDKDKATALDIYKKLAEVNPDNQKLPEFKEQIDEL